MSCEDCNNETKKKAIIGAAAGALLGASITFFIFRYVRNSSN